jgi:branched-chain amino acid transport system ATP-binding protein
VRTFQINTLFPHLTPLEAVTMAVCERDGVARTWWRRVSAYSGAVDEAHAILSSLMLGADCYRPTRELPYGRQRLLEIALALATRPKVLLLDEPAAACRVTRAPSCLPRSRTCRATSRCCSSSTT